MDDMDEKLISAVERMEYGAFKNLVSKLIHSMGLLIKSSEFQDNKGDIEADVGEQIKEAYFPSYHVRVGRGPETCAPEDLQDFVATKKGKEKGMIFITTSGFSNDAKLYAEEFDVEIVDGESLAAMLKKFDLLPDVMMYRDQNILKREKGR